MAAVGDMRHGTELEQIQARSRAVTNKTLDATHNLLALTEESKEAGIQTLVALDDQGEKLDNAERGLNEIHSEMNKAAESLKKMKKWCCTLPWKKGSTKNKKDNDVWKSKNDGGNDKVVSNQPQRMMTDQVGCGPATGHIGRITNDAMEDEMEECMVQVSSNVGNLRNMAIDISSELESQNNQLRRMENKADSNADELKLANEMALKLIK